MSDGGGEIIIKGGSVEIVFNEKMFQGQSGKYTNANKKIVSVEVRDNKTLETKSVDIPADGQCTIRISTR